MDYVIMIGQLMLSLSILIVLHECGHFFPAKWFGTRVEKFYLFFDPGFSLFKYTKGETEYGIGWLPLGGYVKISGMIDESMDLEQMKEPAQPWEFRSKPAWQRLIIMLGGVTVNFVLGFLLYAMVLWIWGENYLPTENATYGIYADSLGQEMGLRDGDFVLEAGGTKLEKFNDRLTLREIIINNASTLKVRRDGQIIDLPIDEKFVTILSGSDNKGAVLYEPRIPFEIKAVDTDGPANGILKAGDQVIALNGKRYDYFNELGRQLVKLKEQDIDLTVVRDRDTLTTKLTTNEKGFIGIERNGPDDYFTMETQEYSFLSALPAGTSKGLSFLGDQFKAFGQMFKGKIKASESLGGFGTIGSMYGTEWIWERFWKMTAIISLILAFMNLLPIPALDGGHVMFLLYEIITGRKPSDKFMEWATLIGFILILGLVVYANGMDLIRWLQG